MKEIDSYVIIFTCCLLTVAFNFQTTLHVLNVNAPPSPFGLCLDGHLTEDHSRVFHRNFYERQLPIASLYIYHRTGSGKINCGV